MKAFLLSLAPLFFICGFNLLWSPCCPVLVLYPCSSVFLCFLADLSNPLFPLWSTALMLLVPAPHLLSLLTDFCIALCARKVREYPIRCLPVRCLPNQLAPASSSPPSRCSVPRSHYTAQPTFCRQAGKSTPPLDGPACSAPDWTRVGRVAEARRGARPVLIAEASNLKVSLVVRD